jgi:hypothetical protein
VKVAANSAYTFSRHGLEHGSRLTRARDSIGSTAAITQWHTINWVPGDEEIEGLTVWNLDDGRAPGIRGQVHVLMLDVGEVSNDDLYFKPVRVSPIDAL